MSPLFSVAFDLILSKLAGKEAIHDILNEFEFRSDRTIDYGNSCPWSPESNFNRLIIEGTSSSHFLDCFLFDPFYSCM